MEAVIRKRSGDGGKKRQGGSETKKGRDRLREEWSLACTSKPAVSSSTGPVLPAPAAAPQPSQTHYSNRRTA